MSSITWVELADTHAGHLAAWQQVFRKFALRCAADDVVEVLHAEIVAFGDHADCHADCTRDMPTPSPALVQSYKAAIDRTMLNAHAVAMLWLAENDDSYEPCSMWGEV